MKKCVSIALVSLLILLLPMQTLALISNTDLSESYVYSNDGKPMNAPAAYLATEMIDEASLGLANRMVPNDLFVGPDNRLYIVDTENDAIHIVDETYQLVTSIRTLTGVTKPLNEQVSGRNNEAPNPNALNHPQGVFVDDQNRIYIADTDNMRVICVDETGRVLREFDTPDFKVAGEVLQYKPAKIALDAAGRIFVVGKDVNRGLLELTVDGEFKSFFGAPKVVPDLLEYFFRMFMTEDQIAASTSFVPTEYNNLCIDPEGFVYATIGTVDSDAIYSVSQAGTDGNDNTAVPIRKLNPIGNDVLTKTGSFAPIGDIYFEKDEHSQIVDVAVQSDGMYSLLDGSHNRVFTYDMGSNLLYIFGGTGSQFGMFQAASSLVYWNDNLVVSDKVSGKVTVFEITEYAQLINQAIQYNYDGDYENCAKCWSEALKYNSNLMVAYNGIGRALYWMDEPTEAMKNLEVVYETKYYSWALESQHKEAMETLLPIIMTAIIVLVVVWIIWHFLRRRKARRDGDNG